MRVRGKFRKLFTEVARSEIITYPANPKHNICAHLDDTTKHAKEFDDIIAFLKRSRIYYAISTKYDAYTSHQQLFWNTAKLEEVDGVSVITARINIEPISISIADIQQALHFEDAPDGLITLNRFIVKGCFLRMKYNGDIQKGMLHKAHVGQNFKYLLHVVLHCMGTRKGGFDELRETLQSVVVALTLNRPFNFSAMIFHHLVENISKPKTKKFLMYPRFLQMIFDMKIPDLPKANSDKMKFEHMIDQTLGRIKVYQGRSDKPPTKKLFGHLANPLYIAPEGKKWRHPESDSDDEDLHIPVLSKDDNDDDDNNEGGNGGASSTANVTSTSVQPPPSTAQATEDEPIDIEKEIGSANLDMGSGAEFTLSDIESSESEKEFVETQVRSQVIMKRVSSKSTKTGPSEEEKPDYIPEGGESPIIEAAIISPTPPSKKQKLNTGKGKGVEIEKKKNSRSKFVYLKKSEQPRPQPQVQTQSQSQPQVQTASIPPRIPMIINPSIAPATTSAPLSHSNVPVSQTFSSLNQVFGGTSMMTVTPTGSPTVAASASTPVNITFSLGPSDSTVRFLQSQIDTLNKVVKMLLEKDQEREKQIVMTTEDNIQAHDRIDRLQHKVVRLEEENLQLRTTVNELTGRVPAIEDESSSKPETDTVYRERRSKKKNGTCRGKEKVTKDDTDADTDDSTDSILGSGYATEKIESSDNETTKQSSEQKQTGSSTSDKPKDNIDIEPM